jgi:hypothetical protein
VRSGVSNHKCGYKIHDIPLFFLDDDDDEDDDDDDDDVLTIR